MRSRLKFTAALGISLFMGACTRPAPAPDALATVGSASLSLAEVGRAMPAGLNADDSGMFVKAYVNAWIDSHLITELASQEVDMAEIDRLVEEYRTQLIVQNYRRKMFETHGGEIPDDSLSTYYDAHRDDFTLERAMVRGVYVKVPDDAANLRKIRKLYRSDRPDDIDALEKEVLGSAIHYDYFRDTWTDWDQIENRIPADFSGWPVRDRSLDVSVGGYTYLLRVTDVLPAGSPMPYESARPLIVQRLLASGRRAYDMRLLRELREKALADGTLRTTLRDL